MSSHQINNQSFFTEVKNMLEQGQLVSFLNKGSSMIPFLKDGTTEVFITKTSNFRKFDICLFKYKNKYILHRIIKIKDDLYYFRGDHLYTCEVVKFEDIIGKVAYYLTDSIKIDPRSLRQQVKLNAFLLFKRIKMIVRVIIKRR